MKKGGREVRIGDLTTYHTLKNIKVVDTERERKRKRDREREEEELKVKNKHLIIIFWALRYGR